MKLNQLKEASELAEQSKHFKKMCDRLALCKRQFLERKNRNEYHVERFSLSSGDFSVDTSEELYEFLLYYTAKQKDLVDTKLKDMGIEL